MLHSDRTKRRRRSRWLPQVEALESRCLLTVNAALLNSWFLSGQNENAQIYQAVNGGTVNGPLTIWTNGTQTQSTAVLADVQEIQYSTSGNYTYIYSADFASYTMGPWWSSSAHTTTFVNLPTN